MELLLSKVSEEEPVVLQPVVARATKGKSKISFEPEILEMSLRTLISQTQPTTLLLDQLHTELAMLCWKHRRQGSINA